jgi:hypothetical protein
MVHLAQARVEENPLLQLTYSQAALPTNKLVGFYATIIGLSPVLLLFKIDLGHSLWLNPSDRVSNT